MAKRSLLILNLHMRSSDPVSINHCRLSNYLTTIFESRALVQSDQRTYPFLHQGVSSNSYSNSIDNQAIENSSETWN